MSELSRPVVFVLVLATFPSGCGELESLVGNVSLAITGRTTGPYLQMDSADSVVISWFTPHAGVGQVEVTDLNEPAAAPRNFVEDQPRTHHVIRVSPLEPGHEYVYRLMGESATDDELRRLAGPKVAGQRTTFAVLGDSGSGSPAQYAVARQIEVSAPDYIIHTGDVVYPRGADADYDRTVFEPYASLMDHVPIFPCLGNHDVGFLDGQAYLENFILPRNGPASLEPERCYSIVLGGVHLVSVDRTRDARTINEVILPWIRNGLAAVDATWKFVVFHHPVYTSGTPTRLMDFDDAAVWGALFDEFGVDLCLSGHNHFYERSQPMRAGVSVEPGEGTVYVVSGGGGRSLYKLAPLAPFTAAANDETFGFALIAVEGQRIEISHIDDSGEVLDSVSWEKTLP